jgi:hypothetical protein
VCRKKEGEEKRREEENEKKKNKMQKIYIHGNFWKLLSRILAHSAPRPTRPSGPADVTPNL